MEQRDIKNFHDAVAAHIKREREQEDKERAWKKELYRLWEESQKKEKKSVSTE